MEQNSYNRFRNRYIFVYHISKGNFGEVFIVNDKDQNVIKAEKKSIKPIQPQDKQKILQQPKLLIKLNHPNIIKGYECIIERRPHELTNTIINQYLHIIMEYFEGKQLEIYFGKLTQMQVLSIYEQLKSAIIYLKTQNIVHRDINKNMNIKITDFGISSDLKGEKYKGTKNAMGKDSYRAPEVWNGKVSMNSDLWALGIVVLELYFGVRISKLYGGSPGIREEFPSEFYKIRQGEIPYEIKRIVEPLLQRDHNKRKFYDGEDQIEDRVIILKHIKTNKKLTKKMTELSLENNNIGPQVAVQIANNLKNLLKLQLNYYNIGKEGAVEIAKNLKNLTVLALCGNNIGTIGAVAIAINLNKLTTLSLQNNNIETKGAVEIAVNLKDLVKLQLSYNNIGTKGAVAIAKYLKYLTNLYLYGNNIETEGAVEIAKNLKNLTQLQLTYNKIRTEGGVEIANNLKKLMALYLSDNDIDEQGKKNIRFFMKGRKVYL